MTLDLPFPLPSAVADRPVHLDPEFPTYPSGERYSYGDPWGVKARPILELSAGDYLFFYATLEAVAEGGESWITPDWGTYLVAHFRLARDPVKGEAYESLPGDEKRLFANNAQLKRDPFDAAVLVAGDRTSRLYDRAVPLSAAAGTEPNHVVTAWSNDSGAGPWWRRPLRFDESATDRLLTYVADRPFEEPSRRWD